MGLNVSYRHFGNQAAASQDVEEEEEEGGRGGERQRGRMGHARPAAMAT